MVRLSVAIQHHPARAELIEPLRVALEPADVLVATDPEPEGRPSPLRTYLEALRLAPAWATHHLVLQDDAVLCRNFTPAALLALESRPDGPLTFFVSEQHRESAHHIRGAYGRGERFVAVPSRRWIPAVALAWPAELVPRFLEYVEAQRWPGMFVADDEAIGRFCRLEHVEVLATVPSLVQHPDIPSLIGRRRIRAGRRAIHYIGNDDPLELEW